jgi:hypothetical protein
MSTGKLPGRFIVVRVELGEVSDHEATTLGDQLIEFAGAIAEHAEILQEGVSLSRGAIVCPNCGNDTFQEHGMMEFRQPVSLKRADDGTLEVADYTGASVPLGELSEPTGIECAHCLHALNVRDYRPGNRPRQRRMLQLINGYCGAPDDPESDLSDALADICHLAASRGFDPDELTGRALSHFHSERQPEDSVPDSEGGNHD